jgi:hypothetical protein
MRRCLRDFYAAGIPMASTSRNLTPARARFDGVGVVGAGQGTFVREQLAAMAAFGESCRRR